ncbi:MAG: ABC transporter ATP-binding protein [Spirochaetales bacterium]|nr:ABC transporter ATP-binding protein [Spirochaetales bacterium]
MRVEIRNLSFEYRLKQALRDISFSVAEHEIVAVLGPNGAGKSTLLKCMNRVLDLNKGSILVGNEDIKSLSRVGIARRMGYVAQRNETARLTAFDAILLGRHPHVKYGISKKDILVCNAIIDRLHMKELSLRYIDQLSGGELQKVCIARALVQEPSVLLLDEPTGSLDLKNQVEILRLIRTIVDGHDVSAVMSLHDINTAIHYADRIVFIREGQIHAVCRKNEITVETIRDVYGIEVTLHYTEDYPVVIPARY